jgi:hypothetical protein
MTSFLMSFAGLAKSYSSSPTVGVREAGDAMRGSTEAEIAEIEIP